MPGYEARERPNLSEQTNFIDLGYHGIQDLTFEGPEHDGLVLDGVKDEALAGLDEPGAHVVDAGDGDHEAVLAGAGALHLVNQVETPVTNNPELTSVKSFCLTVSMSWGPKYLGCSMISWSREMW